MNEEIIKRLQEFLGTESRGTIPFKVVGVLVFGSTARGSSGRDSDIDLLIVAEGFL